MVKLTKAIIKKYGISKKAWAVARGGRAKTRTRKTNTKTRRRSTSMVKRRYTKRRRSTLGGMGLNKGTFVKVLSGLAIGSIVGGIAGDNKLIKGGAGFLLGGIPGAIGSAFGSQILETVSGGMSGVSSAFQGY